MRRVDNERLALLMKQRRILDRDVLATTVGPCDAVEVSPLRSLGGSLYYQFCDGSQERLVVSVPSCPTTYAPLVRPRVQVDDTVEGDLVLAVDVAPYCQVASVNLVLGQPTTTVQCREVAPGRFACSFEGVEPPTRGSRVRAIIQVRVNDEPYIVEERVPYAPVDESLRPAGLAALDLTGHLRVFPAHDEHEVIGRIVAALRHGQVGHRIVEPIGAAESDHGLRITDHEGFPIGVLATRGIRFLIASRSTRELDEVDDDLAREMAGRLSWRPFAQRRAAGRRRGSDPLRRAVGTLPGTMRRAVMLTALKTLGYSRYQRLRSSLPTPVRNAYQQYVHRLPEARVVPRTALHVGFNYSEFSGHLVQVAAELARQDPPWTQTVVVQDPVPAQRTLDRLGIPATVVTPASLGYGDALLTAEVITTDSTLPRWFIARPGQRVFNLWHGTPLKSMGRAIAGAPRAMANTQRNLLLSTEVMLSNRFTIDLFVSDYMVPPDSFALMPSARNTWMFDPELGPRIRAQLGIAPDELVVLYLPTWRGEGNSMTDVTANVALFEQMSRVRARLNRPVRLYAKAHRFTKGRVDPEALGLVTPPGDLDLYEFLAAVDCLVTDYSSIMFDFLVCNRPIILDTHDHDQYAAERGFSLDPSSLGLTLAPDEDAMVAAIESAPAHVDQSALIARFCPEDGPDGTRRVVERMLRPAAARVHRSDRERVLLFPGALWTNGITTSFLNLLSNLDTDKREYWVFLPESMTSRPGAGVLEAIVASGVNYLPSPAGFIARRSERDIYHRLNNRLPLKDADMRTLDAMMLREADRIMPGMHIDHAVNFSGYEAFIAKFFGALTLRGTQLHMWVHNDMRRELELRNNFNEPVLMEAYDRATTIDVVSQPVADRLRETYFTTAMAPKVRVVHNTADSARVRELAKAPVDYLTPELDAILDDPAVATFVTIGRFSPEKDHVRLVEAFDAVSAATDRRTALFLIGGPGTSRDVLVSRVAASPFHDRIHMFEEINPHPILSRCDLFVLSSHYEGLPMVFFEALALDVPILSTAIPGPKEFLESGYGATCANSTEGLIQGMTDFLAGRLAPPTKSLEDFNRQAVAEFEGIFG